MCRLNYLVRADLVRGLLVARDGRSCSWACVHYDSSLAAPQWYVEWSLW